MGSDVKSREETLRILSEEGTSLIDRMYDRIATLKSKNDALLTLHLAIVSIVVAVVFYAVDRDWFPVSHLLLLALYFVPAAASANYCVRLMIPKKYSELSLFYDGDFGLVSNAPPLDALGHIVYAKKDVFDKLCAKYGEDMEIHRCSVAWFVGSLFGLFVFALLELSYKLSL